MRSPGLARSAALIIAAELMFVSMGVASKLASVTLPTSSIVFFRGLLGTLLLLPWLLRHGSAGLATDKLGFHLLRALAGLAAMYAYFYSIAHLPLAEAVLLKMTSPFYIPLIALFWLGEEITPKVRWAVLIGFAGVAVMLNPGWNTVSPVALIALAGAGLVGLVKVTLRRLGATEPYTRTVFYFSVFSTLFAALPAGLNWVTPAGGTWGVLWIMALFGTVGQLLMSYAYSLAPAGSLGPFTYVAVLFASVYGWLWWGETPGLATLAGAGLIVAAGIIASRQRRPAPTP